MEGRALPSFQAAGILNVGPGPRTVAVADLNGDGIQDLAVADNSFPYGVSVLLGNGDGSFQPPQTFALANGASTVAVGDFNGDGVPDLVAASYDPFDGTGTVSVFLGNGDGSFQAKRDFDAGRFPVALAVGDLNGDGTLDLAVANQYGGGGVSLLFGNGDGSFRAPVNLSAGVAPRSVVAADFNGDGTLDLAVTDQASGGGGVNVLLGNGDGTFRNAGSYRAGDSPGFLLSADVNGDGLPDLVTTNQTANTVTVLLNRGGGSFQAATSYATGRFPATAAVGDFNGDGIPDLVTADSNGGDISVLLGQGGGTFGSATAYSAGSGPYAVAVGDWNSDGVADLVVTNSGAGAGTGTVLLGRGDGTFQTAASYDVGGRPTAIVTGDFTSDGLPDLAVANGSNVNVLAGNGDGTFRTLAAQPLGFTASALVAGDFNGDGNLDLAYSYSSCGETGCVYAVGVRLGNGDGTFQAARTFAVGNSPIFLTVADLNGDGIPDLLTANAVGGATGSVSVLLGNGDGSFQDARTFAVGQYPQSLAVGDFNGDGIPDLAVALAVDSQVSVWYGQGDGTFAAGPSYRVASVASLVTGDFNGDGILDLVTDRSVLLGNGDGTFQDAVDHEYVGGALVAGDFNGDGILDVAGTASTGVGVLLGVGDGTFQPALRYAAGSLPLALAAASFRGDGFLDLATANSGSGSVSVLLNGEDWPTGPRRAIPPSHRLTPTLGQPSETGHAGFSRTDLGVGVEHSPSETAVPGGERASLPLESAPPSGMTAQEAAQPLAPVLPGAGHARLARRVRAALPDAARLDDFWALP